MIGMANSPLLRLLPAAYESGTLPRGGLLQSSLPSARTIRKYFKKKFEFLSNLTGTKL